MGTKNVTFEYYRVYTRIYNKEKNSAGDRILCDLTPILEKAKNTEINERNYQVNGEESRLQCIEKDELNNKIWKMSFIRMRENVIPRYSKRYW